MSAMIPKKSYKDIMNTNYSQVKINCEYLSYLYTLS
jgi:hypothetical protein